MNAIQSSTSRPLGQLLINRGVIRPEQLDRALERQRLGLRRKLLGEILVDLQDCSEEQVLEALADSHNLPFVRLTSRLADAKMIGALPREFQEKHHVMPLFLVDGILTVAAAEPADLVLVEQIERAAGRKIQLVVASRQDILNTLRAGLLGAAWRDPGPGTSAPGSVQLARTGTLSAKPNGTPKAPPPGIARPTARSETGYATPAVKLINDCLYSAVKERATAVHIEPAEGAVRVRFRIDGMLVERMRPGLDLAAPVAALLKASAALDPAQTRLPQHGRLSARIDGRDFEIDLSTTPGRWAETLVLRLLDSERTVGNLEKLGFGYDMLKQWRRLLALPAGLLLVSGTVSSGRRTTLYASLDTRSAPGANLCSVEDPIRYPLAGVNQVQIDSASGLTLDIALESVLRQEPDVLMISDLTTGGAPLAARAAIEGRLVLAGLSAADAPTALARLIGLGLDPYLVATSLAGVLSQRLVRKLCSACREPYEPSANEKRQIEKILPGLNVLYRARGCERCRGQGYAGRIGLFELLVPDEVLTDLLSQGVPMSEIRKRAAGSAMTPLRTDGLEKARAGITTLEEVLRVTG